MSEYQLPTPAEAVAEERRLYAGLVPALPWWTGADEVSDNSPARVWIWEEYLARGTVTELDGKVKLSGKTTLCHHLARAIIDGEKFLDRPTLKGPVVYLTEEGPRTFRPSMAANGLDGCADFHILSKRMTAGYSWEDIVDSARQKIVETGAVLLIVDTLSRLVGFKDDDENSSGRVTAALSPLLLLAAELDVAILFTRHDRRAGGDVGESARGSTAISGDVDQILQLSRKGGNGHQNERVLKAVGRIIETPDELDIELDGDAYRVVGPDNARKRAMEALLKVTAPGVPFTVGEVLPALAEMGHSRKAVYAAINSFTMNFQLASAEAVKRTPGSGRSAQSFCFTTFKPVKQIPTAHPQTSPSGEFVSPPPPFRKGVVSETKPGGPEMDPDERPL